MVNWPFRFLEKQEDDFDTIWYFWISICRFMNGLVFFGICCKKKPIKIRFQVVNGKPSNLLIPCGLSEIQPNYPQVIGYLGENPVVSTGIYGIYYLF